MPVFETTLFVFFSHGPATTNSFIISIKGIIENMSLFYNTRKRFYSCILWLVYEYGDKYSFEFCSRFPAGRVEPLRQAQIYKKKNSP